MNDLFADVLRANLVLAIAVAVVMALRLPVRRWFGAHVAYGLWLIAPFAFLASLIPATEMAEDSVAAAEKGRVAAEAARLGAEAIAALHQGRLDPLAHLLEGRTLTAMWLGGAALAIALVALGQARFLRHARAGKAGPALVGVITPRIVTPAGYEEMFTADERALVRAHERAHIDRGDPKVNAALALAQCLCWFNPLVHIGAHLARQDQELACDATVMKRKPGSRRLYAETMLKTQLSASALPLGCHWLSGRHPLEARIGMLKQGASSETRRLIGAGAVATLALAGAFGAWAAQPPAPPRPHFVPLALRPEAIRASHSIVMIRLSPGQVAQMTHPGRD